MSFRNTIDPTIGKRRQNAGKSYQESSIITTSPVRMFRKNAGKVYTPPTQQIIEVIKPQFMRVGGKQRGIGEGAIAEYYQNPDVPSYSLSTTGLWCAASISRRIVSSYTGPLFKARVIDQNGSSSLVDFTQSGGFLDISGYKTSDLIIPTIIYDQSGSSRNLAYQDLFAGSSSEGSFSYLKYHPLKSDFSLWHRGAMFVTSTNFGYSSDFTVYLKGNSTIGLGFDGYGSGFGYVLRNRTANAYTVINGLPYSPATGLTSTFEDSISWLDLGVELAIKTVGGTASVAIPSGTIRSSTINWGIGVDAGSFTINELTSFREMAIYNTLLSSTDRDAILDGSAY